MKPGPDNPRAFPSSAIDDAFGGMTLWDHYAGLVMQAAFAGPAARMIADRDGRYDETNWAEVVALNAYEMADVMIAERARRLGAESVT